MVKAFLLIFGLLAVTSFHPGTSGTTAYKQKISLYMTKDCTGDKTSFKTPNHNLSSFPSPFYTASVNGMGLVYYNPNFNAGSGVINVPKRLASFSDDYHNCFELPQWKGKVGSLRFVGDMDDYRRDSLNLYTEANYQGQVQLLVTDAPKKIIVSPKSLIITGKSAWTLYEDEDYNGAHHCFNPVRDSKPYEPSLLVPKMPKNMSFSLVSSARKGCK